MSGLLDRETVLDLLRQLGARLDARGIQAEVYVVGGTAMVPAYDRSRLTRDVDAVTEQQEEVEAEARAMALGRSDLAPDWFNGRVRPMLPRVLDADRAEAIATSPTSSSWARLEVPARSATYPACRGAAFGAPARYGHA